jgi:integrase
VYWSDAYARKVTVPTQLRDTDRTTLTWWQLRGALSKLNLRDRILLELDMTNALRPGELFALRWQCFSHTECTMQLVETVYKGKIRPWGKTRKSLGSVHVPKELADDLWLWKQRCPNPSPDAFIFPNKKGGFMDSNNYRNRVLHGLAQELELPKLTFQVIRRTIATLAQKKGTVKDIQGVLRHSRIERQLTFTCRRFRRACRRRSTPSVPSFDSFLIWKRSRAGRAFCYQMLPN